MEQVVKTIASKLTKHILDTGMCMPYVLKFKRCHTDADFVRLGLDPQAIHFVINLINRGVVTKEDISTQLASFINGNFVAENILDNVSGYSGEYYCQHINKDIKVRTNTIHLIGCENLTLHIPIGKAPIIYVSNECRDISIVSQGLNIVNLHVYDSSNVILKDTKMAKSINIYKYSTKARVRNEKFIKNVHTVNCIFKVN